VVPALAIADVLAERGYEVHFCGGGSGMEKPLVTRAGYPFSPVRIRGFKRRLGMDTLTTLASIPRAGVDAWRLLRRLRPVCVVGVGAYASGPVVAEAAVAGIPALAVEMDAHLGWTNRILSLLVDKVCLSFPVEGRTGGKYLHTGRPIRPRLLAATREEGIARFDLDPGIPVVLVFGGSLGARTLNEATLGAFARGETPFSIVHVTGERDFPRVSQELARPGGNARYQVHAYLDEDDFPLALAAATVAVSRAGGSVAELLARGVPALLVPFPLATADHQTKNAMALQAAGAAVMVPDGEFDPARMKAELAGLLQPQTLERMIKAALALARPDAATRIADEIVELAAPRKAR
jgi:UDP-N-acetylglucosamine--N-acetylmuramyl-(pentapeptide) pyrophosphoryl-undecaprenol N-acetylglucosamine transferase